MITNSEEEYLVCERCKINSFTPDRMIPCPRGGCEAECVGMVKIMLKVEIDMSNSPKDKSRRYA